MREYEDANGLQYLGKFNGEVRYIPKSTDESTILGVVDSLKGADCDEGAVRIALYEIWLTTKHEKTSEADRDAMLMVYVKRLTDYPAQAIWLVLSEISQESKFFPAWAEIKERLDALMGWRSELIGALRRVLKKL